MSDVQNCLPPPSVIWVAHNHIGCALAVGHAAPSPVEICFSSEDDVSGTPYWLCVCSLVLCLLRTMEHPQTANSPGLPFIDSTCKQFWLTLAVASFFLHLKVSLFFLRSRVLHLTSQPFVPCRGFRSSCPNNDSFRFSEISASR